MIDLDGWFDFAERVPGPPDKTYSAVNRTTGYVAHSAVGFYAGWAQRLFSTERRPDGRYTPYAAASTHGWIGYDGKVIQHYPVFRSCWHAGSEYPNTHFVAFENEGGFRPVDEPLTDAQLQANARIVRELSEHQGWPEIRRPHSEMDLVANLYEHNECIRFGSAPTACPSNRIDWNALITAAIGQTPPPVQLSDIDLVYACVSTAQFLRMGWRLTDLHPNDKAALHQLFERANA